MIIEEKTIYANITFFLFYKRRMNDAGHYKNKIRKYNISLKHST